MVAPFPALGLSPTSLRLPSASSSFLPLLPFLSSFSPPSSLLLPSGVRITHQPHGPLTSEFVTRTPHTTEFVRCYCTRARRRGREKKGQPQAKTGCGVSPPSRIFEAVSIFDHLGSKSVQKTFSSLKGLWRLFFGEQCGRQASWQRRTRKSRGRPPVSTHETSFGPIAHS